MFNNIVKNETDQYVQWKFDKSMREHSMKAIFFLFCISNYLFLCGRKGRRQQICISEPIMKTTSEFQCMYVIFFSCDRMLCTNLLCCQGWDVSPIRVMSNCVAKWTFMHRYTFCVLKNWWHYIYRNRIQKALIK